MLARHSAHLPEAGVVDRLGLLVLGGGLRRARYAENNPLAFVELIGLMSGFEASEIGLLRDPTSSSVTPGKTRALIIDLIKRE